MSASSELYAQQVAACAAAAAATNLPQVRERHLRSQDAWQDLLDRELRSIGVREARGVAETERREAAASASDEGPVPAEVRAQSNNDDTYEGGPS